MGKHDSGEASPREPNEFNWTSDSQYRFAPANGRHAEHNPEMDHSVRAYYDDVARSVSRFGDLHEPSPEPSQPPELAELVAAIHKQGERSPDTFLGQGADHDETKVRGAISDALRRTAVFVAPISWANPQLEAGLFGSNLPDDDRAKVIVGQIEDVLGAVADAPDTDRRRHDKHGNLEIARTAVTRFTGVKLESVRTFTNPDDDQTHDRLELYLVRDPPPGHVQN